jgi:hypothetical protein
LRPKNERGVSLAQDNGSPSAEKGDVGEHVRLQAQARMQGIKIKVHPSWGAEIVAAEWAPPYHHA